MTALIVAVMGNGVYKVYRRATAAYTRARARGGASTRGGAGFLWDHGGHSGHTREACTRCTGVYKPISSRATRARARSRKRGLYTLYTPKSIAFVGNRDVDTRGAS